MSAYQVIPMKALVPSENNYRRSFDQAAFDELVASVRAKGVLQPIHVRPMDKKKYEIVAGHRRHKAALEAGLKEMPAIVLNLTDEEALEIQVIENTQREDPNPMDEAVGFKRLLEMGKHTPETLAEKIGHSVKYVLARTRLLGLTEEAQEAVAKGDISLGHALLISRLKNEADQNEMLEMVQDDDGMTVKEAASRMRSFSTDLADADFALDGCATCMARTRNQADLFPDLKDAKDECMDRECYNAKTLSHWAAWADEKATKGFQVFLNEEDMPKMASHGRGNGVALIAPKAEGKQWNETVPPRYAKECAKCKTHHGFYLYQENYGNGFKELKRGEICLSADCLDEMLKKEAPKEGGKDKTPKANPRLVKYERENLAADCMKRFLTGEIAAKMALRPEFAERIKVTLLFNGAFHEPEDEQAFFKEFLPGYDPAADEGDIDDADHAWKVLKAIPKHRLEEAKEALFIAQLKTSWRSFLKVVAKDADIDAAADFTIDAHYLEEFSGQDLRELVAELWPDAVPEVLTALDGLPDETVREYILTQDLKGRLPKELAVEEAQEEETEQGEEDDD